jgi:Tol biopolymer transport system component
MPARDRSGAGAGVAVTCAARGGRAACGALGAGAVEGAGSSDAADQAATSAKSRLLTGFGHCNYPVSFHPRSLTVKAGRFPRLHAPARLARIGPYLSLYRVGRAIYACRVILARLTLRPSIAVLVLLLPTFLGIVPAQRAAAALPGRPGPIVFSLSPPLGGPLLEGGLFSHGPRVSQPLRQLTFGPGDQSPSVSPDGQTIVFSHPSPEGPNHLFLMDPDGSDVRQLTDGPSSDSYPSFAPDGRKIVFSRWEGYDAGPHLFLVDIGNGAVRQLTTGPSRDMDPVFTPDGRNILFTRYTRETGPGAIFALSLDSGEPRLLIGRAGGAYQPDVSPDGRKIAFGGKGVVGRDIFVAEASGHHVRRLTNSQDHCSGRGCFFAPAWAPDGKHIVFRAITRTEATTDVPAIHTARIEVMRANGTRWKEFVFTEREEGPWSDVGAPAWGSAPR